MRSYTPTPAAFPKASRLSHLIHPQVQIMTIGLFSSLMTSARPLFSLLFFSRKVGSMLQDMKKVTKSSETYEYYIEEGKKRRIEVEKD